MRGLWDRIPALARALGIVALIAGIVVVLSLEPVVATVGGILQIAFFLAVALFLFMLWRERRGDLEAWSDWNRKLFYAAVVLAVVAIGLAIGYGLPESRDAFALVVGDRGMCVRHRARLAPRAPLLSDRAAAVAPEVVGAGSKAARLVVGVQQRARVDRKTSTADARREPVADRMQRRDLAVEVVPPDARQPFPVAPCRRATCRKRVERRAYALQRDACGAARLDERDPSENRALVSPLVPARAARPDEPLRLVEAECGRRDAATGRNLSDGQLVGHLTSTIVEVLT